MAENEEVKKRNGGVHVPEEWLLVQAKKIFAEPDVTPADQIQVHQSLFSFTKQWIVN